jgi:hypothetical protein
MSKSGIPAPSLPAQDLDQVCRTLPYLICQEASYRTLTGRRVHRGAQRQLAYTVESTYISYLKSNSDSITNRHIHPDVAARRLADRLAKAKPEQMETALAYLSLDWQHFTGDGITSGTEDTYDRGHPAEVIWLLPGSFTSAG